MVYKLCVVRRVAHSNESKVPRVESKVAQDASQSQKEQDACDHFCDLRDAISPFFGCIRADEADERMQCCPTH
jgi:hypothetical protein